MWYHTAEKNKMKTKNGNNGRGRPTTDVEAERCAAYGEGWRAYGALRRHGIPLSRRVIMLWAVDHAVKNFIENGEIDVSRLLASIEDYKVKYGLQKIKKEQVKKIKII